MELGQTSELPLYELMSAKRNTIVCYSCNRTGAYHLEKGFPSQDACHVEVIEDSVIFCAVADGHGDAKHDLSQFGASFAVQVGINVMKSLFQAYKDSRVLLYRSFRDDLPRLVLREWREMVKEDATSRVILSEEANQTIFSRYGTTLLLAMVTDSDILVGQLGDGEVLYITPDEVQDICVEKDHELIGNVTYSLSSAQSLYHWHITRTDTPSDNGCLFLTTDGLSNCFADDKQFHTFAKSFLKLIKDYGMIGLAPQIPKILDEYSQKGSRDDISVAFIHFKGSNKKREEEEQGHADYKGTSHR